MAKEKKSEEAEKHANGFTKQKLETLGKRIVGDVRKGETPKFVTTTRTRSNILYDKKQGFLRLGANQEERSFMNVAQSKKFMQTMAIAAKCHKFLTESLHTTIRGLFYQLKFSLGEDVDESIFDEQAESNPLIEDLEVSLGVKREDLNLNANRKGVLAGNMKVRDTFGNERVEIDCSKMGRSGWQIPSDVDNDIEFVDIKAKYVLVVEKDALWQRLNEDNFWKKENVILITPQGQASRGTRRIIRKLADKGLPVYVFTDSDAWGWYIYWTIKTGSINLAYIGGAVATPEARFIGVTMSDLDKYTFLNKLTIAASEVDIKRAQEMLNYEWIKGHKEWVVELERMIKSKKKLEQDALQGPRLTFVGEYIKDKVKNNEVLP
ncbi:MAG: DNA topoisomerase IV subunit A [Candidatus Micrarchaeota archaeon]|nr:DNA topoisomerase IV subunit A [Candidatus Micrarchaeota archaeon]MDE1847388.1 DNA topoisomerase IV subunit A [Candidatus Micrarchaeota archaeon]MDE1864003.1 DNA topoisomerase IV subunit A [Candidatus Micrarchaeota archaeon]